MKILFESVEFEVLDFDNDPTICASCTWLATCDDYVPDCDDFD